MIENQAQTSRNSTKVVDGGNAEQVAVANRGGENKGPRLNSAGGWPLGTKTTLWRANLNA